MGDQTVTELGGQQAAVQWETPIRELPLDTLLAKLARIWMQLAECFTASPSHELAATSSSPAPHTPELALATAPRPEGSGSGAIITFDLIEGNVTAEPSWLQHSALPHASCIL